MVVHVCTCFATRLFLGYSAEPHGSRAQRNQVKVCEVLLGILIVELRRSQRSQDVGAVEISCMIVKLARNIRGSENTFTVAFKVLGPSLKEFDQLVRTAEGDEHSGRLYPQ